MDVVVLTGRLLLLRHAMPVPEPGTDPAGWLLSAAGTAAAARLAPLIPAGAVLVASDEPKARATLTAAAPGRAVRAEPGLREVRRPVEPLSAAFREARRAYVAGRPPDGWEPPAAVAARIQAAVDRHRDGDRPLVLAGHGMAFTTWLTGRGLLGDPVAFWDGLRLPDLIEVGENDLFRRG